MFTQRNMLWIKDKEKVPATLLPVLEAKIKAQAFDAGSHFSFSLDKSQPEGHQCELVALTPLERESDVFLIDHTYSFLDEAQAKQQLQSHEALRSRLAELSEMDRLREVDAEEQAKVIFDRMWPLVGSYSFDTKSGGPNKIYYIMDEVGSRLVAPRYGDDGEHNPAFRCTLVLDRTTGVGYHAFWPIRAVGEGEVATCVGIPNTQGLHLAKCQALDLFHEELDLEEEDVEDIQALRAYLEYHSYTDVELINRLLGLQDLGDNLLPVWDISAPLLREGFLKQLASTSGSKELALLIQVFLMGVPVLRHEFEKGLSPSIIRSFHKLGLLVVEGEGSMKQTIRSVVQLTPLAGTEGCIVATDSSQSGQGSGFDPVMYVGVDSLGLVAAAPRKQVTSIGQEVQSSISLPTPTKFYIGQKAIDFCAGCGIQGIVKKAIDFCAGCGIQGIVAAKCYVKEHVTLVEVNPRAVRFARFNVTFNDVHGKVKVVQADLLTPSDVEEIVKGGPCDVILANPPYIPNPSISAKSLHRYGDGGPSGEEVTRAILRCIPRIIHEDAWLYLVANLVNVNELPKRFLDWWEEEAVVTAADPDHPYHCQMKTYHGLRWSASEYASLIHNHASATNPAVARYTQALQKAGVEDMCNGFIFAHFSSKVEFSFSINRTRKQERGESDEEEGDLEQVEVIERRGNQVSSMLVHEQIWQAVAMGAEDSKRVKDELARVWL